MSKLYLVGAGPGDPDLITIKAQKVLQKADVVLYDALVNRSLLDMCPENCQKVYVGKKPGIHKYQQIFINDLIVEYGLIYQNIVRLKGGDPFIFGRGHEELLHAREHGMDVEMIPGISSANAVPCLQNIPMTARGINESFWVVTGTTTSLNPSGDIEMAAKSSATVIILMGMRNLESIVEIFQDHRGCEEPIGIIQNGTRADEKAVYGILSDISDKVNQQNVGSPAIIVIGKVVGLRALGELVAEGSTLMATTF